MTITFKCGHKQDLKRDFDDVPRCQSCGERVVKSVTGATPRFTGSCSGPLVQQVSK